MLVTYLRSSSIGAMSFCQQSYMLQYVLGFPSQPNIRTAKGSAVHRTLEGIGRAKLAKQNNETYIDELAGEIILTDKIENLTHLKNVVFDSFVARYPNLGWSEIDRADCSNWVDKVLNDPTASPLNKNLVAIEKRFDFPLKPEWAKCRIEGKSTHDGKAIDGVIALCGTIDVITRDGILGITDYKTGKRLNWATSKVKDYHALRKDHQLRLYHYVVSKLYPDEKQIVVSINFINDGGIFDVPFSDKDIPETEEMIRIQLATIQAVELPRLRADWTCKSFCYFGRHGMDRKRTTDEKNTICAHIHRELKEKGMDEVVKQYTEPGHKLGAYTQG